MLLLSVKDSIVKIFIEPGIQVNQKNQWIPNNLKFYNERIKKINDKILSYSSNFISFFFEIIKNIIWYKINYLTFCYTLFCYVLNFLHTVSCFNFD